ncbi:MAG: hypothetical protein RIS21_578 [Planctomycetota bacterium]|jgi:type IV pilus assembly protein PilC
MTTFRYNARDEKGRNVSGTVEAPNPQEAATILRRRSIVATDLRAEASSTKPTKAARPGCRKGELELFTRQMATMIGAGIPLLESLEVLEEQAESPGFKTVVHAMIEDIRGGTDLSAAMGRFPKVFSTIYVSMVRAGEASGQLTEILTRLAEYLEASQKLKRDIKSAMTYPVISLCLVFAITGFLMIGIVPKFKEIFDGLGVPLPGITQALMGMSLFLRDNVVLAFAGIAALVAGFMFWKRTPRGTRVMDRFILTVPVFGPLFRKVALSRFARTFSTLIRSGVPIVAALEIVGETSGNTVILEAVTRAADSVKTGESLAAPLAKEPVFPPMVTRMISIGERTGALEQLLGKVSEFYDQQVEAEVKALTSLIEPILIVVMGVVVGGIVLAVFLPIFKLQEALGAGG